MTIKSWNSILPVVILAVLIQSCSQGKSASASASLTEDCQNLSAIALSRPNSKKINSSVYDEVKQNFNTVEIQDSELEDLRLKYIEHYQSFTVIKDNYINGEQQFLAAGANIYSPMGEQFHKTESQWFEAVAEGNKLDLNLSLACPNEWANVEYPDRGTEFLKTYGVPK